MAADATSAIDGYRETWFAEAGDALRTPVYSRDRLVPGNVLQGPAIVEQMDTTTVVLPGMHCCVDAWGNLVLQDD